jgi:hypothetical protein
MENVHRHLYVFHGIVFNVRFVGLPDCELVESIPYFVGFHNRYHIDSLYHSSGNVKNPAAFITQRLKAVWGK